MKPHLLGGGTAKGLVLLPMPDFVRVRTAVGVD